MVSLVESFARTISFIFTRATVCDVKLLWQNGQNDSINDFIAKKEFATFVYGGSHATDEISCIFHVV